MKEEKVLRTVSIHQRKSLVHIGDLMKPVPPAMSMGEWIENLPNQLAAKELRSLVERIIRARQDGRKILLLFGAHLVKCGLSRLVIQWMEKGLTSGLATNGAGSIHDFEMAYAGKTSEDVAESLRDGSFGMCEETGKLMNGAINKGAARKMGMGEAIGEFIETEGFLHRDASILAAAYRLSIPLTVHVAMGTDIIHPHPEADGAALGATSFQDYRRFERIVQDLDGGVVLLFGSAVILPEVFLKALSVARNLGHRVENLTVANFDMIRHYRPTQNVLNRPTLESGQAFSFIGHHEIMFPLLTAAVLARLEGQD